MPHPTESNNKLPRGHQARIARALQISETAVSLTLRGKSKSAAILREHERLLREYQRTARKGGRP